MDRQALDVAALALGIEGVESQGRLAGAGRAGDNDKSITRDRNRQLAQVMLAGTVDADVSLVCHG
jgi:hypothetical protein